MLHKKTIALLTTAAALGLGVTGASAAVVVTSTSLSNPLGYSFTPSTLFTFDGPGYPAVGKPANFSLDGATFAATPATTGGIIEHGSKTSAYAAPTNDGTNYLALGGSTQVKTNLETISLSHEVNKAGLYWGSIDTFNTVSFYLGGKLVGTITGTYIDKTYHYTPLESAYVNFGGASFNKIVLSTTRPNFELDNVAIGSAVPEPATWAMMLLGFGGLGALMYRRSKSAALPSLAAVA